MGWDGADPAHPADLAPGRGLKRGLKFLLGLSGPSNVAE